MAYQQPYQMPLFPADKLYSLSRVEDILVEVVDPVPNRQTLINWCESGYLLGKQLGPGRMWHVYQSSLDKLISEFCNEFQEAA